MLNLILSKDKPKKRKIIDIETKLEIIEKAQDVKNTITSLSKQYDLPISTISTILNKQNQEKLQALYQNNLVQPNQKRIKRAKYDDLNLLFGLRKFCLQNHANTAILTKFDDIEDFLSFDLAKKQTNIFDFFSKS